jgi:ATP-binding cassette subfamily B multidrug efflux pump
MSEQSKFDVNLLKRLIGYIKPYKSVFIIALISMVLLSVLGPVRPLIIIEMINSYIVGTGVKPGTNAEIIQNFIDLFISNDDITTQLLAWTVLLIVLLIIEGFVQFFSTYFSNLLGQSIIRDVRIKLYKHFNSFKLKYFDNTPNGTVVTRLVSDIEAIADVFSIGLITMLGDILKLIIVVCLMFYISWELSLLTLIPIPLLLIATRIFAKAMKKAFQKERIQVNKLNTFVQEHLSGMFIVQLFNRQKIEYKKFVVINKEHRQAHFDAVWANSIFFPVVELLSSLSIAALIVWGDGKGGRSQYGGGRYRSHYIWIYLMDSYVVSTYSTAGR